MSETNGLLTTENLEAMYDDDRWLGFGYLGERRNALDSTDPESPAQPEVVAIADAEAFGVANNLGFTHDQLFEWTNSRTGRYYGDCMFGNGGSHMGRYLPGQPIR